jgi:hypothetical protein
MQLQGEEQGGCPARGGNGGRRLTYGDSKALSFSRKIVEGFIPAMRSSSEESALQAYIAVTNANSRLAGLTEGDCMAASSRPLLLDRTANLPVCKLRRGWIGGGGGGGEGGEIASHMSELMPCISVAATLAFACKRATATDTQFLIIASIRGVRPSLSVASILAPC